VNAFMESHVVLLLDGDVKNAAMLRGDEKYDVISDLAEMAIALEFVKTIEHY